MTEAMKPVELTVVDTNTATWELFPVAYIGANLEHVPLMSDPAAPKVVPAGDRRAPPQRRGAKLRPNDLGIRRRITCQRPPA